MKCLVQFIIFGLIVGGWAAPTMRVDVFNEECGAENGVSRSEWNQLPMFGGNLPSKIKCYINCDLEKDGTLRNGRFTETYLDQINKKSGREDEESTLFNILKKCTEGILSTDSCEIAAEYTTCVGTLALAITTFVGIVDEYS